MEKYKSWDPNKSKWKAALEKGVSIDLKGNENILYLGASSGTTVEQLSQRTSGIIFAVEKSFQMAIPLVNLSIKKRNIAPVFCDARDTEYIKKMISDNKVNVLFQDIPSLDQVDILTRASSLVTPECLILLSLKTQSISQEKPESVKIKVEEKLKESFKIISTTSLEPFHKKHFFFVLNKK